MFCFCKNERSTAGVNALLMICPEKILHLAHCVGELFAVGEINDAEVVGLFPMEAAAVSEQYLFVPQKIEDELFVVFEVELFLVQPREDVESRLRSYGSHSVDAVDKLADALSLLVDASAGEQHLIDLVKVLQRIFYDILALNV